MLRGLAESAENNTAQTHWVANAKYPHRMASTPPWKGIPTWSALDNQPPPLDAVTTGAHRFSTMFLDSVHRFGSDFMDFLIISLDNLWDC